MISRSSVRVLATLFQKVLEHCRPPGHMGMSQKHCAAYYLEHSQSPWKHRCWGTEPAQATWPLRLLPCRYRGRLCMHRPGVSGGLGRFFCPETGSKQKSYFRKIIKRFTLKTWLLIIYGVCNFVTQLTASRVLLNLWSTMKKWILESGLSTTYSSINKDQKLESYVHCAMGISHKLLLYVSTHASRIQ